MGSILIRILIYGALFCLILFAGYRYFFSINEEERQKSETVGAPAEFLTPAAPQPGGATAEALNKLLKLPEIQIPSPGWQEQQTKKLEDEMNIAAEKLKTGDYEGAFKLSKELSEKDKRALTGAGIACFKLGDYANAISFLEKAAEFNKSDFTARKVLAFAYYQKDDLQKSLDNAEIGLSLNKDPELQALYDKLKRDKNTQQSYIEESTEHFKILFDGYEHGKVNREIISILEDAYRFVGRELDYFPAEPLTVILYTNKDFYDTTQAPTWSDGIYDGKIRLPVRGIEGQGAILKKVLFHEYTHAVVHSLAKRCPLWINEGLAEYFSRSYPQKIGQVIPLNYLETSFAGLGGNSVGLAYWESYSAVSYLVDKHGLYKIKDLLFSFSKGTDINNAFKDAFGIKYNEFVSEWGKN